MARAPARRSRNSQRAKKPRRFGVGLCDRWLGIRLLGIGPGLGRRPLGLGGDGALHGGFGLRLGLGSAGSGSAAGSGSDSTVASLGPASGSATAASAGAGASSSTSAVRITRVPQPEASISTVPDASSPSQATVRSGSSLLIRMFPSSPMWRASRSTSLTSVQSSGGDFTRVRLTTRSPIGRPFAWRAGTPAGRNVPPARALSTLPANVHGT